MLEFERMELNENGPIYLQLIEFVKSGIATGRAAPGEPLPSRRLLSAQLGVNPNTVQKAFHQLEEEGLVKSVPGSGSVLVFDAPTAEAIRAQLAGRQVRQFVRQMTGLGFDRGETAEMLKQMWNEEGETK